MKKMTEGFGKICLGLLILVLFLNINSCSESNDDSDSDNQDPIDLLAIEGRYVGTWSWFAGTGPISIDIHDLGSNNYSIALYESINFVPCCNTDGITPDAQGSLQISENNVTVDLVLNTNNPPCAGDYTGIGIKNADGNLTLTMDIVHNCAQDAPATWNVNKISN